MLLAGQPPFVVNATEDVSANFPDAPRIQAFSFGQWRGRWVFIGGRVAGYHTLGGASADFPRAEANRDVWVVDTTTTPAHTYHVPVTTLGDKFQAVEDEWQSSGQLYYQDGPALYMAGGYGEDSAGNWVTSTVVSRIDLPSLIDGVMKGSIPEASVKFTRTPLVQSAGGALVKLSDGYFYVVMGHVFTGSYSAFEAQGEANRANVSQTYLNETRKLEIKDAAGGALSVRLISRFRNDSAFHRRDMNVVKLISPKGVGLAVYGGVFTPDTQLSYSKPVYLVPGTEPVVDAAFDQKMNAYNTAKLLLYDESRQTMFTVLFGGISRFIWDIQANCFFENPRTGGKTENTYMDGLQWSDQISVVQRTAANTTESVQAESLPGYVGTEGVFIPAENAPRIQVDGDVLDLTRLRGKRTLVGYLYGGIRAYPFRFPYDTTAQPYNSGTVPTKASDMILKVYLTAASQ
jgi:hypothetical protein